MPMDTRGGYTVFFDADKQAAMLEDLIAEFEPSLRQEAFLKVAQTMVSEGILTRRQWVEHAHEHDTEFEHLPLDLRTEVIPWWRDEIFKAWFFQKVNLLDVTEEEKRLMDVVFWGKLAEKMAGGNMEALKLFSKVRIESAKGGDASQELQAELRAFAKQEGGEHGWGTETAEA